MMAGRHLFRLCFMIFQDPCRHAVNRFAVERELREEVGKFVGLIPSVTLNRRDGGVGRLDTGIAIVGEKGKSAGANECVIVDQACDQQLLRGFGGHIFWNFVLGGYLLN